MNPTDEQLEAVRLATSGRHLAVDALAGTGKTSTCVLIAHAKQKQRGAYLAFNREIARDAAAKFPPSVSCSTVHSLAFRAIGHRYQHRLKQPRLKSHEIADRLGINGLQLTTGFGVRYLPAAFLAGIVTKAVRRFAQSSDPEPAAMHVPTPDTMRDDRELLAAWQHVQEALVPAVRRAWADITNPDGVCPFDHDCYLRLWEMNDPVIPADYLLLDEAQDLAPAMMSIAEQQAARGAQLIVIGDEHQSIYGWRGARNAMAEMDVDARAILSGSFRFGEEIAEVANRVLVDRLDSPVAVRGLGPPGTVGPCEFPDVILSRTNAVAVRRALEEMDSGGAPHIIGGASDVVAFARGALDLQSGRRSYHPELACFESWDEVRAYVSSDELGRDLKLLVGLVDDFGADRIVASLAGMPPQERATLVLSTAHAAKGREWAAVRLADDFPDNSDSVPVNDGELRLLYVAVTRARTRLDVESVGLLRSLVELA